MLNLWGFSNYKNNDVITADRAGATSAAALVVGAPSSSSSGHNMKVSPLIYDNKNHDHHDNHSKSCIICLESDCSSGILCDQTQIKHRNIISDKKGCSNSSTSNITWGWSLSTMTNGNNTTHYYKNKSASSKIKNQQSLQHDHFICNECFASYVKSLIEDIGKCIDYVYLNNRVSYSTVYYFILIALSVFNSIYIR